jgi:hypothetical protein
MISDIYAMLLWLHGNLRSERREVGKERFDNAREKSFFRWKYEIISRKSLMLSMK